MLTTFNTVQLPEARDEARARHLLEKFATTPLLAFVIRNAGETNEQALQYVADISPETMHFNGRRIRMDVNTAENQRLQDFGLHTDFEQQDDTKVTGINMHHTTVGRLQASFFMPGPLTLREIRKDGQCLVPFSLTKLFRNNQVDTDYMGTTCHQTIIGPGDAVIFKEGMPLVHDFLTLETPRRSCVHLGVLAVPCLVEALPR